MDLCKQLEAQCGGFQPQATPPTLLAQLKPEADAAPDAASEPHIVMNALAKADEENTFPIPGMGRVAEQSEMNGFAR